jgi:TatD DNase family protein
MVPAFADLGAYFSFNGAFLPETPLQQVCHLLDDKPADRSTAPSAGCHTLYDIPKKRLRRLAIYRTMPADRLLVETDAPAMSLPKAVGGALRPDSEMSRRYDLPDSPDGHALNHPANIALTYAALAELRGTSTDALATQVAANFTRLFGPLS